MEFLSVRSKSIALNRWCGGMIRHYGISLNRAVTICLADSSPTYPNNSWRRVMICPACSRTIQISTAMILTETYCNHRSWVPQSAFNIRQAIMYQSNCSSQPRTTVHHHQMQATKKDHRKHGSLCVVVAVL